VVVRCAEPDNQVDRSRVNELIYCKEVPRAHLGKGHIGIWIEIPGANGETTPKPVLPKRLTPDGTAEKILQTELERPVDIRAKKITARLSAST
jgi:hypothetical protein